MIIHIIMTIHIITAIRIQDTINSTIMIIIIRMGTDIIINTNLGGIGSMVDIDEMKMLLNSFKHLLKERSWVSGLIRR